LTTGVDRGKTIEIRVVELNHAVDVRAVGGQITSGSVLVL
jgi:hypothetical protein